MTTPQEAIPISVRDTPPPTPDDALGLDSATRWTGTTVTYGFPGTVQGFTNGISSYSPYNEPGKMLLLSAFGKDTLREGFQQWNALTTLTITEAAPGTLAQVNAGGSTVPSTAWAYYPGGAVVNGDIWFNTSQWFLDALSSAPEPVIGSYAYATGMHEFGHALGLKHPHQASGGGTVIVPAAYDAVEFTIMSYRSYPGGPASAYTMETWGYPQSPMMLDIAMIQKIYGADYSTRSGHTTYTVSTATGEFFIDSVSQGVPGANRVFRTIWDGDGTDHIDLANYTTSMYADLNPGRGIEFDTDGTFQAARLASGVHAGFNIYMSLLHNGDTRSLIEDLTTGTGNDILIGNAAANVLTSVGGNNTFTGGLGADRLVLGAGINTVTDTLVGLNGDTILGFDVATDRMILQDAAPGAVTATLASGVLTLTMGSAEARVVFEGLGADLNEITFIQDHTALELVFGTADTPDADGGEGAVTAEALLAAAIAAYTANGKTVFVADDGGRALSGDGVLGSVLQGGAGNDRLRENAGDDVMYGGAGADQFVWDLRARHETEHDMILDLAFAQGDEVRILTPSSQIWLRNAADLTAALDSGVLRAEAGEQGTVLRLAGFDDRALELVGAADAPNATPDQTPSTSEDLLADAIAAYLAGGQTVFFTGDRGGVVSGDGVLGSVLQGGAGNDRLRENAGDDVMYGGAGADQFVWDLRARHETEHDMILDLAFAQGDEVRILTPSSQIWLRNAADLTAALDSGVLRAEAGELGMVLRLAGFDDRALELAFIDDPFALA